MRCDQRQKEVRELTRKAVLGGARVNICDDDSLTTLDYCYLCGLPAREDWGDGDLSFFQLGALYQCAVCHRGVCEAHACDHVYYRIDAQHIVCTCTPCDNRLYRDRWGHDKGSNKKLAYYDFEVQGGVDQGCPSSCSELRVAYHHHNKADHAPLYRCE